MCEIAILDPRRYSDTEIKSIAFTLYEAMRSSLGVVGVRESDDRESFEYDIYRSINPDKSQLLEFITETTEKGAFRVIIHGRLATQGAVIDEHAHPLEVDCDECSIDYVIHNGVIGRYTWAKRRHEDNGHEYNTEVDSEVIAHEYGELPDSFDDLDETPHERQPALILMNDERVLINSHRYHLAEDGTMARSHRDFGPDYHADDYVRVLLYPTEGDE